MDVQWFIDLVKALGVGGGPVFAILWWLERKERKDSQENERKLQVQVLTGVSQMVASVEAVRDGQVQQRELFEKAIGAVAQSIRSIKRVGGT